MDNLIGWFIHRKFQDVNGEYFYKGVSVTKTCIVAAGVLVAAQNLSTFLAAHGIGQAIVIPNSIYEAIGVIGGIAARDAVVQAAQNQTPGVKS